MADRVRIYLPATMRSMADLVSTGRLDAPLATAVTPELRAALPESDEEDLELEALLDAADLSLALLAADPSAPRRRVVLAADVPADSVRPGADLGPAAVRLLAPVPLDAVVSAHVDEPSAMAAVVSGELEDVDLLWYAAQELPDLILG